MRRKTNNTHLVFFTQCLPRHPAESSRLGIELINSVYSLGMNWKVHWLPLCLSFPTYDNITEALLKVTLPSSLLSLKRWRCHVCLFCSVFYL